MILGGNTPQPAPSATKLAVAKTINSVPFDGTANITITATDSTKEPAITPGTSAQYWRGDKTWQTLNPTAAGLSNVTNDSQVKRSEMGAANGVATLNSSGQVPSAQLPSYVDDVLEYANYAALPGTGETGKIYITLDTNYEYRWSGSVYVRLVASPGTTDALTEGTTNLYFTTARVLSVVLTGLSTATNAVITSADSILVALGKLQAQISSKEPAITAGTTSQYLRGDKSLATFATDALAAAPAETATTTGTLISGATAKATPVDADTVGISDSAASGVLKKVTWANIKATLKTYFDGLYPSGSGACSGTNTGDQSSVSGNAGTATKLATARAINGVNFDGSAAITINAVDSTARLPVDNPISTGFEKQAVSGKDTWFRKTYYKAATGWTTFATFTPSGAALYGAGFIEVWASGYKNGASDSGATFSRWYYNINNGAITVAVVGTNVTAGTYPPQIQLTTAGGVITAQVAGQDLSVGQFLTVSCNAFLNSGLAQMMSWATTD